jgi:hypothetical protein
MIGGQERLTFLPNLFQQDYSSIFNGTNGVRLQGIHESISILWKSFRGTKKTLLSPKKKDKV